MNMPSGVVSIFFTLLVGYGIRKQSNRWFWIICCVIPAYVVLQKTMETMTNSTLSIIGGTLMTVLPVTNRSGSLAGIYLVNAVVAPLPVLYVVSYYFKFKLMPLTID
jgi:uncharacterized membrane protein YeaQ/YmgE (transglycosylase-associated protein family)